VEEGHVDDGSCSSSDAELNLRHVSPSVEEESDEESSECDRFLRASSFSSDSSSSSSSLGSDDGVLHGQSLGPGGDVVLVDSGEKEGDDEILINSINSSVNAMRVGADLRHVLPSVEEESDEEESSKIMNYDPFQAYSFSSDSSSSSSSLGSDDGVLHGPSLGPGGDVVLVDSGEKEGDDDTTINSINSNVNAMRVVDLQQELKKRNMSLVGSKLI
jgi:hypothetical protein